jgi:hypothetical protein
MQRYPKKEEKANMCKSKLVVMAVAVFAAAGLAGLPAQVSQAQESLTVNLASPVKPFTGVGEGFLYGISQDGTQPADQYILPLDMNAFRGGGHVTGGWIADNYSYGSNTMADVNSVIAQATRITQGSYHAQYQVILSDIYGADGGQPSNTVYPCTNGNCSNWVTFLDDVVGALQASGLHFAYDIWNEPELSIFWGGGGFDSTQYFQMWDTAVRTIHSLAPGAIIVGPSAAYTPSQDPTGWSNWLSHTKAAGTLPNMITNHDEGDGDDPVAVANQINAALATAGISPIPLSANEYLPADQQTAGQDAYYLARFAQSGYTNATRGNWVCCLIPNLAGVLTNSNGTWEPNGMWWDMRTYADMTGELVSTSGEVGTTAISASEDSTNMRVVALLGDENGYTGAASVTFDGLSAVPWLDSNGMVQAVVYRIPDSYPLLARQVVFDQALSTSGGSVTVNLTFQASHDAFGIYLTPASGGGTTTTTQPGGSGFPSGYGTLKVANDSLCLDSFGNTTNAGAVIDQWACNGGSNQDFQFVPTSGGYGELQVESSGQDVTVLNSSTAQGQTDIVQEPVNGNAASQWLPEQQSDGSWQFQNLNSGLCLDVYGATSNQGQQLDQWPCKNAPGTNQDFLASATGPGTTTTTQPTTTTTQPTTTTTVPSGFPSGYHTLVVANDSLCLDSFGNTANAGAIIDQWACNGGSNQDFQFVPTSGGYGELQVESSGQDVTAIAEGSSSASAQGVPDIAQEPVSGTSAAQWRPEQQTDGSWQFQNQNSGLCLDVYGAGSNQGQQLDQWPCKNAPGTNQDFKA